MLVLQHELQLLMSYFKEDIKNNFAFVSMMQHHFLHSLAWSNHSGNDYIYLFIIFFYECLLGICNAEPLRDDKRQLESVWLCWVDYFLDPPPYLPQPHIWASYFLPGDRDQRRCCVLAISHHIFWNKHHWSQFCFCLLKRIPWKFAV